MTTPAAFRATYSDLKLIKTRQCVQIVFELPLADFDAAYKVLGGMPNPAKETWFGIAPLKSGKEAMPDPQLPATNEARPQPISVPAGAKRDWKELQPQQQAGIRCNDPIFKAFLKEQHAEDWNEIGDAADFVRSYCNVASRVELGINHKASTLWHQLDAEFQAWEAKERVGA